MYVYASCQKKFYLLLDWDSVMRKVGLGEMDCTLTHLGFTFSWSAVQLLQFFNYLSSRCKTCFMTFRNCCAPQANCACGCCSPLPAVFCSCSPHPNTVWKATIHCNRRKIFSWHCPFKELYRFKNVFSEMIGKLFLLQMFMRSIIDLHILETKKNILLWHKPFVAVYC